MSCLASATLARVMPRWVAGSLVALTLPASVLASAAPAPAASGSRAGGVLGALASQAPTLRPDVLALALGARDCAAQQGILADKALLTVIDYSLPSTSPRLWVLDVAAGRVLYSELVAHGKNSGDNLPTRFSNANGSLQTSLGLFVTADTYVGTNGYSLRLHGLEPGVNHNAIDRAIVMHGAPYVDLSVAKALGRIGRSWGCPALRASVARDVIDLIKGGTPVFAYYPDDDWLRSSRFAGRCAAAL